MLEPRAPNPGRVLERGRNNPWAAEQTAMGFKSISLQIDISKGAGEEIGQKLGAPDQGRRVWNGEQDGGKS